MVFVLIPPYIKTNHSPISDDSTRFCIDYCKLNAVTIRDQYPLPQIQDIFDQVGCSTIFSSLDLKAGP